MRDTVKGKLGARHEHGLRRILLNMAAQLRPALDQIRTPADADALGRALKRHWPDEFIEEIVARSGSDVQREQDFRWGLVARMDAGEVDGEALVNEWTREATNKIKSVRDDVAEGMRRDIVEAIEKGTPHEELAQRWIRKGIPVTRGTLEGRMTVIARDQIGTLNSRIQEKRAELLGIEEFIWRTQGDSKVRDEHEELDGQRFRYDDPPPIGLPGRPINCRCYAESVMPRMDIVQGAPEITTIGARATKASSRAKTSAGRARKAGAKGDLDAVRKAADEAADARSKAEAALEDARAQERGKLIERTVAEAEADARAADEAARQVERIAAKLSTKEVAKRVGVTSAKVSAAIRKGELKAVKKGRSWEIDEKDFVAWQRGPVEAKPVAASASTKPTPTKPKLSTKEVAKRVGVTSAKVSAAIRKGELKAVKKGRSWEIDEKDFVAWQRGPVEAKPVAASASTKPTPTKPKLSTKEVAKRVGVTSAKVSAAIRKGELKAVKKGRSWEIDEKDFVAWQRGPVEAEKAKAEKAKADKARAAAERKAKAEKAKADKVVARELENPDGFIMRQIMNSDPAGRARFREAAQAGDATAKKIDRVITELEKSGFPADVAAKRRHPLVTIDPQNGIAHDLRLYGEGGIVDLDESEVVWVDPAKIDAAWKNLRVEPDGTGQIGNRLEVFSEFLKTGTPIQPSKINVNTRGEVEFTNGRHRFATFRSMGLRRVPMIVDKSEAEDLRRIAGVKAPV